MTDSYRDIHVVCYAGYRGEQEPRRFAFAGRRLEVAEILDRWLDPRHRTFKVRANDDGVYMLRHEVSSGQWDLSIMLYGMDPGLP